MSQFRPLQALINQSRRAAENEDVGVEEGIQDVEFIQYFNDAQRLLQNKILRVSTQEVPFTVEKFYDVVALQEAYNMPDDAFFKNRLVQIDFSRTGNTDDFYPLRQRSLRERDSFINPDIDGYILRNGQFLLNPIPQFSRVNSLRVNYVQKVAELDIKRFKITAVTTVGSGITALTLGNSDGTALPLDETRLNILEEDVFFTVIDSLGNIKMKAIQFDAIDAATGVVTVNSSFVFEDGETIAVDNFICKGRKTTDRIQIPVEAAEGFCLAHVDYKIKKRDSSEDSREALEERDQFEAEVLANYGEINDDIQYPTIIDESFL